MSAQPRSVTVVSFFIVLNAIFWLAFGLLVAFNLHPALPDLPAYKAALAVISFLVAGLLLGLFFLLRQRNRVAYLLAVGLFAAIALALFFDQFGWPDFAVLLLNLTPLALLLKERNWYWPGTPRLAA